MVEQRRTIEARNLSTGYEGKSGKVVVAEDINASLFSGELTCLLGPNGAGKSTLLKTLTAFIPPLSGEILIEGKLLSDYSDSEISKVISVVLTDRLSVDNMTVEELIALGRSPYTGFWGRLSQNDHRIVDEAIALVNIESLRFRAVQTLSDGERQKVMIAKSLAQETPVIFLDEPTAFLDYPSKVEIMQLLRRLAREKGKTVFLSTHDLELALQIADKVWLLDKRLGVTIGTPEDLSLNGEMNRYFQREGVSFDMTTGLFKISYGTRATAIVKGEGAWSNMVRKALARNAVTVMDSESVKGNQTDGEYPEIVIETLDDGCLVNGRKVLTISDMLELVRKDL